MPFAEPVFSPSSGELTKQTNKSSIAFEGAKSAVIHGFLTVSGGLWAFEAVTPLGPIAASAPRNEIRPNGRRLPFNNQVDQKELVKSIL